MVFFSLFYYIISTPINLILMLILETTFMHLLILQLEIVFFRFLGDFNLPEYHVSFFCQTCIEMYEFTFCSKCTLKQNMDVIKFASKKYLPSLFLFPLGFIAFFVLFGLTKPEPLYARITAGIIGGWGFGGAIWGWYLIGTLLGPNEYLLRVICIPEINDLINVIWSLVRIFFSIIAGFVAMPVGLVKLKKIIVNAKKIAGMADANKTESEKAA